MDSKQEIRCRQIALINPASRGGRTGLHIRNILELLHKYEAVYKISTYQGHMYHLAKESHMFERIISIGGDGTIGEILRGMDRDKQVLTIVPAGTGNSIANDLKIRSVKEAIKNSFRENVTTNSIDLLDVTYIDITGRCETMIASSVVSIGYTSKVVSIANQKLKHLGKFCYPLAAMFLAGARNKFTTNVCYNKGLPLNKTVNGILIGNTRFTGCFEAFPMSRLTDGLFHVLEFTSGFVGQNVYNIAAYSRLHFYRPDVPMSTNHIRIVPDTPQILMIDGEIVPNRVREITVACIPKGVRYCI